MPALHEAFCPGIFQPPVTGVVQDGHLHSLPGWVEFGERCTFCLHEGRFHRESGALRPKAAKCTDCIALGRSRSVHEYISFEDSYVLSFTFPCTPGQEDRGVLRG